MSRKCVICGKSTQTGHRVSHSNIKTKRTWKPNIQRVKALINGVSCRVKVCTRCLKSGKIKKSS